MAKKIKRLVDFALSLLSPSFSNDPSRKCSEGLDQASVFVSVNQLRFRYSRAIAGDSTHMLVHHPVMTPSIISANSPTCTPLALLSTIKFHVARSSQLPLLHRTPPSDPFPRHLEISYHILDRCNIADLGVLSTFSPKL